MGGVHVRSGNLDRALPDLNRAIELDPNNLLSVRDRAEAKLKTGDADGAIIDYDRRLARTPADGRALCGRGEARLKKGHHDAAMKDLTLAARLGFPGASELVAMAAAAP